MKRILMIIFILLIIMECFAVNKFDFGIKSGLVLSKYSGTQTNFSGLISPSTKQGFNVVGLIRFNYSEKMKLNSELSFIQKGSYWENEKAEITDNLNYFQVNIPLEYRLFKKIGIYFGPYWSKVMAANQIIKIEDISEEKDFKKLVEDAEFGLLYGFNYSIWERLFLDFRFSSSFQGIFVNKNDPDWKNSTMELLIGYWL